MAYIDILLHFMYKIILVQKFIEIYYYIALVLCVKIIWTKSNRTCSYKYGRNYANVMVYKILQILCYVHVVHHG